MQISVNNFLLYLFFFVLLSNCSIGKNENFDKSINAKDIFKKIQPIKKELNSNLKIAIKKTNKEELFFKNNSNNNGNSIFKKNFKKKSTFNFSTINEFEFIQPELIFIEDKGTVFFDGKGAIFKTDENLKKIWKVNYYSKKEKKLDPVLFFAQSNKDLIAVDTLSKLFSINLNNGELNWSKESLAPFNSNIKIFKDKFIALDFENIIRCFSIKDGTEIWNFSTENLFIKSQKKLSLVLNDEVIYFTNSIGDVTALNANEGNLLWQTPTQSNVIYQNAFSLENSDLVFANNTIYFSNNKNEIFSIDARSGIIKWKQTVNSSLRPTIIEDLLFTISEEGYLFVIDNLSGNIVRITDVLINIRDKKNRVKPSGFIVAENKIYLSLNNGRLVKIDVATGKRENIIKINSSKISRPYVFNNNMYLKSKNSIIKSN